MNTHGHVIYDGRIVGHIEYYGSSDRFATRFYDTEQEVMANWRTSPAAVCKCPSPPCTVRLYDGYGHGTYFPSLACLKCHAITGITSASDSDEEVEVEGHPLGKEFETENVKWNKATYEEQERA